MQLVIWILYLATDVYGHLALKAASGAQDMWRVLFSVWGVTAGISWMVSGLMWMLILSKHPLLTANTISALTYVLIALSASAVFHERVTHVNAVGIGFVCIGIYLVLQ